jgi:hypothetical protein
MVDPRRGLRRRGATSTRRPRDRPCGDRRPRLGRETRGSPASCGSCATGRSHYATMPGLMRGTP